MGGIISNLSGQSTLTLLALQSHSGLQVVHLHLQALQREVILVRLPSVGQQHHDDDDEEQPSSGCDAEDGGKGQQAVGADVNFSWRDVEASYLDLDHRITKQVCKMLR